MPQCLICGPGFTLAEQRSRKEQAAAIEAKTKIGPRGRITWKRGRRDRCGQQAECYGHGLSICQTKGARMRRKCSGKTHPTPAVSQSQHPLPRLGSVESGGLLSAAEAVPRGCVRTWRRSQLEVNVLIAQGYIQRGSFSAAVEAASEGSVNESWCGRRPERV